MRRATSRILLLLYLLIAALFLCGLLARYVHPRFAWWLQLAGIILPYSALGLLASSVVVYFSKRKWLRRIHLALLVLALIRFPPTMLTGPRQAAEGDLVLLTYNTPTYLHADGQPAGQALTDLLEATQPHVFSLQEGYWRYAFGRKGISGRADVLAVVEHTDFSDAPDSIADRIFTHQPVLSRIGIDHVEQRTFRRTPEQTDPLDVMRVATEWQGKPLVIYNVHLASYGTQKPWQEEEEDRLDPWVWRGYLRRYRRAIRHRAWEAEQIRKPLESEEQAFVLTGDFNATPHNWTYRRIASGLRDAARDTGGGTGFTYHRKRPIARIDFVLASRDFKFTSARTVDGGASDHLGVLATLRWTD